jgi:hypothetical protein
MINIVNFLSYTLYIEFYLTNFEVKAIVNSL